MQTNAIHNYETIEMLSIILEEKDSYTAGHSKRVAYYATNIAERLCLPEADQNLIYQAGLLHDIGKILTPETILLKPKRLTKKEHEVIQKHVTDGEKILEIASGLNELLPIVRHHHEHYNGKGYPEQLQQEEIPLLSRILCVADSFDAMTTNRIYKARKTNEQALAELKKNNGKQFDPNVVDAAITFFTSSVELTYINQLPKSEIQEERLAFYYKDRVSSAFTCDYLDFVLKQNQTMSRCIYLITIRHMHQYNQHYGWKAGDMLLKEMVKRIRFIFEDSQVFRIFGDDFIVLTHTPALVSLTKIAQQLLKGLHLINVDIAFFSSKDHAITSWEDFEPYLKKEGKQIQ